MNGKYLKTDLKHFLVNLGETAAGFLFYFKFGFYGWAHLTSVLIIQYVVMPFDDWLEHKRPFPTHAALLTGVAFYFYPLVTTLALLGDVVVNLQAILKKQNFWLERLEGLGNIPIYILPFSLPIGLHHWQLYVAAVLFILFADSFHKIGHRETKYTKLMWSTGLLALTLLMIIFATPTITFAVLAVTLLTSLVPFVLLKEKIRSWAYTQVWFGLAGLIGYYYYLFVVV
ncbi:MAG: hypothetical protein UX28_C0001G0041 [Candidatus Pacebacteria bacterium GW2011_GWA1_46_10]|nr:MAG: hypothetical protein UX28_C0001G0041 [Candidatus Pacebacteria bacterium GW2011_GWA1_46_10]HCR80975.1 hypothetical protein [Candidatus Paceibacterota bacterium]